MKFYEITTGVGNNFSCIYCWTNLINNKRYIGQTQRFYDRMVRYRGGHFNPHMKSAIEKYGFDNFDITILEKDVPLDKLDEREQYWMDYYESYNPDKGYNICPVAGSTRGTIPWNKGVSASQETKDKISNGLLTYYSTHTVWNKGIPQTEEAKEKNRIANTGERNGMYGQKHTESSKARNREAHLGKKMSKETREKISTPVKCVETGKEYLNAVEAAKEMGCTYTAIWLVLKGKNKTAKGFHWEYIS